MLACVNRITGSNKVLIHPAREYSLYVPSVELIIKTIFGNVESDSFLCEMCRYSALLLITYLLLFNVICFVANNADSASKARKN